MTEKETVSALKELEVGAQVSTAIQEHKKTKLHVLIIELYPIKWLASEKVWNTIAAKNI